MPLFGAVYDFSEDFNKSEPMKTDHPMQVEMFYKNVRFFLVKS